MWRVSVWGEDDLGMDIDFQEKDDANEIYNKICSMNDVTFERLKKLGLKPF